LKKGFKEVLDSSDTHPYFLIDPAITAEKNIKTKVTNISFSK
jgi:hypothetical protein